MSEGSNIYETHFDGEEYIKLLLNGKDYQHKWIIEEDLHRLFTEGKLKGKTLLDVGCGPLIRAALSGSAFVPEIHLSDLQEQNRNIVEKWLNQDPNGPDYSVAFKHVAQLEGQTDYKLLEKRARDSIKEVFRSDILADNPLTPRPFVQYDIVVSTGVLDCFIDDKEYTTAMKNLGRLVKPGGHLFFVATLEATNFVLCGINYPALYVTVDKVTQAMNEADLKICDIKEYRWDMGKEFETDNKGNIIVLAAKPSERS